MKNKLLKTVCAWMGHSFQVVETCFGYIHCGRCGEQIGDALGGVYDTKDCVIIGHNCKKCRANWKKLSWKEKLFVKNPFKKDSL